MKNTDDSQNTDDLKVDLTKLPAGHDMLKPLLNFLPSDEAKGQLLAGFTLFLALM
jgi:hypothetical protein